MKTGYVISDLHLFTNRSCATERMPEILQLAEDADLLVLNGDIVDFRWSTFFSIDGTINAALGWLNDLSEHSPECLIYYIMGNHDANQKFARALDDLHHRKNNFRWSPSHLHFEDYIFFHGDCISDGETIRNRRIPDRQMIVQLPLLHRLYGLAVSLRMHRLVAAKESPFRNVKKIDHLLECCFSSEKSSSIRNVYFGHSHVAFSDLFFNGRHYFNTGSLIRYLRFLPQKFLFHSFDW